jgi:hypothetical protein
LPLERQIIRFYLILLSNLTYSHSQRSGLNVLGCIQALKM